MRLFIFTIAMAVTLLFGCVQSPEIVTPSTQQLLWREAESYTTCSTPREQVTGIKAAASQGKALEGAALSVAENSVTYAVDLPIYIPSAFIHFRYARLHYMKMPPSKVELLITSGEKLITRTILFGDTGGWGSTKASDWAIASASLGEMKPGKWQIQLTAQSKERGDTVLDGFFIAPDSIAFSTEDFSTLGRSMDAIRCLSAEPSSIFLKLDLRYSMACL